LPLPDESLDRLTTRNTIIYVDDPERTIREFRRVLRASGRVHAIEGDWPMMVIEPVRRRTCFCHSIERAIGAFKMHCNNAIKEQIASNRSNHRSME